MVVVAAVAGVIVLVLIVVVIVLRRRVTGSATLLIDAERRLVLADERAEKAESDARAADARRTTAEERAAELEGELTVAKVAVSDAEQARDEAIHQVQEARDAGARLIEASALRSDAGGLWFLEAVAIERRWRATLGNPEVPLFEGDREPAFVALEAVAEIIREESGTSFDIDWHLDEPLPPSVALAVVRAGDEVLSALAIASDGGALEVDPVPEGVRLTLRVDPEPELPPELLAVFGVLGWELGVDRRDAPATILTIAFTEPLAS